MLSLLLMDFRVLSQAFLPLWGHLACGRGGGRHWQGRQPVCEDGAKGCHVVVVVGLGVDLHQGTSGNE